MINQIDIEKVTSYRTPAQTLGPLKAINFIYGANGSGKTTISKVLAGISEFAHCPITWRGGIPLETLVYNRDFVEQNFHEEMRGIFTLGQPDKETIEQIDAAVKRRDELVAEIVKKNAILGDADKNDGKIGELASLRATFVEQCWTLKKKYDGDFSGAFSGVRNSKVEFAARLERESAINASNLYALEELQARATTVFSSQLDKLSTLPRSC
jgi:wobble nucleotide-excising tRNase